MDDPKNLALRMARGEVFTSLSPAERNSIQAVFDMLEETREAMYFWRSKWQSASVIRDLPECPSYMAHPQSVWFNEHWLPIFQAMKSEIELLKRETEIQASSKRGNE